MPKDSKTKNPFPQELVVGMYCSETLTHEGLMIALTLNEKRYT